jgi:hypothetical protein
MIRRQSLDSFLLIAQHDHALLSRRLAERIDALVVARPQRYEPVMLGIGLHDSGWPLHDDRPVLNEKHLPLDVFETPRAIGLEVWCASVDRAAEADPYAGLLVSLHVLALSQLLANLHISPRDRFEINKFHHVQIERQEAFRRKLGLRTDLPLQMGLAQKHLEPQEDSLRFDLELLQAMDRVSLALCCTHTPFDRIARLSPRPGADEQSVSFESDARDGALSMHPWLFDTDEIHEQVPCRRVPATPFTDPRQFRAAFDAAPVEMLQLILRKE